MLQDPQECGANLGAAALPRSSTSPGMGNEGEPRRAGAPRDEAAAGLKALAAGDGITSHPLVSPAGTCCAGGWR